MSAASHESGGVLVPDEGDQIAACCASSGDFAPHLVNQGGKLPCGKLNDLPERI